MKPSWAGLQAIQASQTVCCDLWWHIITCPAELSHPGLPHKILRDFMNWPFLGQQNSCNLLFWGRIQGSTVSSLISSVLSTVCRVRSHSFSSRVVIPAVSWNMAHEIRRIHFLLSFDPESSSQAYVVCRASWFSIESNRITGYTKTLAL